MPIAVWSPVIFACAAAPSPWRRFPRAGLLLAWLAVGSTLASVTNSNYSFSLTGVVWGWFLRLAVPLWLGACVVAIASLVLAARVGTRARAAAVAASGAMYLAWAIVTGMVIIDSGNRLLFKAVGVMMLASMLLALVVWVAHRRSLPARADVNVG